MEKFRTFMHQAVDMGLTEKCYILAGVTPMKNLGMANFMAKFVPGMDIPDALKKRLKGVEKTKQAEEGIRFALEQVEEFKQMEGVAGVHLMAIEWEHRVPEIAVPPPLFVFLILLFGPSPDSFFVYYLCFMGA